MEAQGAGGGTDPRAVLPAELWFKVLDNLVDHQDPRDLVDASEACRLFEYLVRDHVNSHKLAEVAPMILKWLGHADLLNLRCVSKRVTKSVDAIFDNVERVAPNQNLRLFQSRFLPPVGVISSSFENSHFGAVKMPRVDWERLAQLDQFHREKEAANLTNSVECRPMIGRTLQMCPWVEGLLPLNPGRRRGERVPDRVCLDRFIQQLPPYGDTLRHVYLSGIRCTGNLIQTYEVHRRILTALPNLYTYRATNSEKPNGIRRLKQHILQNPLPPMRYLEEVSLGESHPVPVPVVQELCDRYGAQLKRLGVDLPATKKYGDATALRTLPALTHLKISNSHEDQEKQPPVTLLNVQANNLVDIDIKIEMVHTSSMLPEVVQYLKRFPRLASLSLDLSYLLLLNGARSQTILATGVRCPSVKNLKIKTVTSQLPLTFFTELFPHLESVSLELKKDWSEDKPNLASGEFEDDLKLLKENRGWECAVWGSCPSLKVLRFQNVGANNVGVYARDAYQPRQNGNQQRRQFFRQIRLPNEYGEDDDYDEVDDEEDDDYEVGEDSEDEDSEDEDSEDEDSEDEDSEDEDSEDEDSEDEDSEDENSENDEDDEEEDNYDQADV